VRNWFDNQQPLIGKEREYIECKEDLVTLRNGRECASFDSWVENAVQKLNCRVAKVRV
jgi:hypothetical protein